MPYEDAKTYRFNPFDLTKVWPHSDYPLIKVGTMTLNKNPDNFFAQIEQAAFEPSAIVPGIGFSPDKMLLGRVFAYARHAPLPDRPELPAAAGQPAPGRRTRTPTSSTVRWPTSTPATSPCTRRTRYGRGYADETGPAEDGWETDGEMVRAAYALRPEDDDFGQAGTLVREVWDDAQRERFVHNVAGHILGGVSERLLPQVFDYWKNVDADTGKRIEELVMAGNELLPSPHPAEREGVLVEREGGR